MRPFCGPVLLGLAVLASGACGGARRPPDGASANLLSGLAPRIVRGVRRAEVLTDGAVAPAADPWNTDQTATFRDESSFVEYDLGGSKTVRAAYLQADNNDAYAVSMSDDGVAYRAIWSAPPRDGLGLQDRTAQNLTGRGRYLRITPVGGDGAYSASEIQVFSAVPGIFPPTLPAHAGLEIAEWARGRILLFALAVGVLLLSSCRRVPVLARAAALGFGVYMAVGLVEAFLAAWPVAQREVSLVRATAAALSAFVVASEALLPARFRPAPRAAVGVLAVCAIASVAAFFNLGRPQFRDHRTGEPSFVHNFDMRVYYPTAKYFPELGFDGVYLGSVAAYVEDAGVPLASLAGVELRDLRTHRMTRVADVAGQIEAVRRRFSPERWAAFKQDMSYFRQQMGADDYLGSMRDHGGNATPVWIATARLLYAHTSASNKTLLWGALLDPLLLLAMFVMVGRTFGARTALVSAVMFGANDCYMFGTDWAGATLRHDWLAALGIGICLLRKERYLAGGALLALSATIRAFPALALAGAAIPFGSWLVAHCRRERRLPRWNKIGMGHPVARIAIGAGLCIGSAWLLSSLSLSFHAWADWLRKVAILDRDPHLNDISLRALVAGSLANQQRVLVSRLPLFVAGVLACVVAVVLAARGKRPVQTAVLGTLLIPVVFNPANYYIQFSCVLPLLANELTRRADRADRTPPLARHDAFGWMILLLMCTAQYWTVLTPDLDLHFQWETVIFFSAAAAWLLNTIQAGRAEASLLAAANAQPALAIPRSWEEAAHGPGLVNGQRDRRRA